MVRQQDGSERGRRQDALLWLFEISAVGEPGKGDHPISIDQLRGQACFAPIFSLRSRSRSDQKEQERGGEERHEEK